ncbi:MAG: AEC family transporter [Spongiibacteraceae bacterium]
MNLIAPLLPIMLPVILCAALGFAWRRFEQPFDNDFISRIIIWVAAPALIISTLGSVSISPGQLEQVLQAAVVLLLWSSLFAVIACLVCRLSIRDYAVSLVFGNFGNMGLPLCMFAFGEAGLALAISLFLVTTTVHFSLGSAVLSGRGALLGALRSPIVYAGAFACVMVFNHWALPLSLQNTLGLLGGLSIPLMLLTLGSSLSNLALRGMAKPLGLALLRLTLGLSAGLATVYSLELDGLLRKVVILQSAMPAAVFNYLLALQYQRQPDTVAGMVISSTLISFISIPVVLYFLGV